MVYKNFRTVSLFRILLLTASIFLFVYTLVYYSFHITPLLIGLIIILQIVLLFKYVDKVNRDLTSFLESIRFSEFTLTFQTRGMGASFDELNKAFNDVIQDFQKVRSEKEEHFQYLQSIVQNIDVSILAYQRDGTVEMVNKSAKKLFQVSSLRNIKSLETISPELVATLTEIKPGENKLVRVQEQDDLLQLAIYATELKIHSKEIILSTIKNIQNVLEEQETEAWQKLIRVLTHEIMNSITPIASLSSTLEMMLKGITTKGSDTPLDMEAVMEIQQALQTINKRSTGLLHFVNTYRNLTRIPKPNFRIFPVADLISNVQMLMEEELRQNEIKLITSVIPPDIEFSADEQLLEQVMINMVKNAIQALTGRPDPKIVIKAFINKRGRLTIQVQDNGQGILQEVLDKIFIPFFTTKPKGSGIGLSLSRQIMRLHGGTITANSEPDVGTTFTLTF
ncbi:MAG: ATP-binding protein [Marinilabiliales bacterium]|nr:MAG: ATP-binding protein [Marinilabiliales bacterium]